MFDLTGRRALVTGSSQGIGKELAKALAEYGAEVIAHGSRQSEKLCRAAEYIGAKSVAVCDIFRPDAADILFEQTGEADILILNASVQYKRKWNEYSDDEIDMQIECNLKSSYRLIKKYCEPMKRNGWGRIVTVGSVNQYNNHPELSLYGVTKAAQKKLVENLAPSLAPYGVTINNIAPGAINTPRNDEALADEAFRQKVISSIPAGYVGAPDDMNGAALLLCGNAGRYITGSEIIVDGGMHL